MLLVDMKRFLLRPSINGEKGLEFEFSCCTFASKVLFIQYMF